MTSTLVTRSLGVATALFALAIPLRSHAGGVIVTAHPVAMTMKTVSQTVTGSGDGKEDKVSVNASDVFETCVGHPAAKDEGIYLFLSCSSPNTNLIAAIDTDPLVEIASVGSIAFDLDHSVETTKDAGATIKTVTVPFVLTISCNAGDTTGTLTGIMDVKFAEVSGFDCPDSLKAKLTGIGFNDAGPGDFIVDDGSSFTAKKRSGSIGSFPPL